MRLYLFLFLVMSSSQGGSKTHLVELDTDVDYLYKVLYQARATNVVEAMSLLSDAFFKRGQYALVFESRSPQRSSVQAPRVLLFGKDKKLRIGFNHNRKEGQNLEVIQFRESTNTWEFREIHFSSQGPSLSAPNPNVCFQCHDDHKPKFNSALIQSLEDSAGGKKDISPFLKKKKLDPIYKRLEWTP